MTYKDGNNSTAYIHPSSALHYVFLSFSFTLSCSVCFLLAVLEKTVEGEAAALIKAKTLYRSCTNESESAQDVC